MEFWNFFCSWRVEARLFREIGLFAFSFLFLFLDHEIFLGCVGGCLLVWLVVSADTRRILDSPSLLDSTARFWNEALVRLNYSLLLSSGPLSFVRSIRFEVSLSPSYVSIHTRSSMFFLLIDFRTIRSSSCT